MLFGYHFVFSKKFTISLNIWITEFSVPIFSQYDPHRREGLENLRVILAYGNLNGLTEAKDLLYSLLAAMSISNRDDSATKLTFVIYRKTQPNNIRSTYFRSVGS
jgi:hypothetical protein